MSEIKRMNETFITVLERLAHIMTIKGDAFRARAYSNASTELLKLKHSITSPSQLKDIPHIGKTIMDKLVEYVETGTLKIFEQEKQNPLFVFCEIYGVGPKKAQELVDKGITSIAQLREVVKSDTTLLNANQMTGLNYYEDILERIPREEIEEYKSVFKFLTQDIPMEIEIVGSYRRGMLSSGDIDVIITSHDPRNFELFLNALIKNKLITKVLSRGTTKCLVIAKLQTPSSRNRRIDFLYTSPDQYPFALLYFTGSKGFNTVMRQHALDKGYTMNEHELCHLVNGSKGVKVSDTFRTEEDIFTFLGLVYKSPNERIDGSSVVPINIVIEDSTDTEETIIIAKKSIQQKSQNKIKMNKMLQMCERFKKEGINYLELLSTLDLQDIILWANSEYHSSGTSPLTDFEYDALLNYASTKHTSLEYLNSKVGCDTIPSERKVKLPYYMGSMNKIKPSTNALTEWKAKFSGSSYHISAKLDGVSGLYVYSNREEKLYTRGNGTIGQDVSHLLRHLNIDLTSLRLSLPLNHFAIRGEFILPKTVFREKYEKEFANARNLIAGVVNSKTVRNTINDVHFVMYELIAPAMLKISDQFSLLSQFESENRRKFGVQSRLKLVRHQIVQSSALTNELLSDLLVNWREKYDYEIDGLIVTDNARGYERKPDSNPEHSIAFKMVLSDQVAEVVVLDVLWSPSKDGYLKPRVQVQSVELCGVTIDYATGFNALFIKENCIGPGAVVQLVRSGDVIPHIMKVVVPAKTPKLPEDIEYKWTETGVDIMLLNKEDDSTVREKNITGFFKGIGVDGLSSGNVSRLMTSGYDSIIKILNMEKSDFLKVDGFKEKMADKLYNGIKESINNVSLVTLMSASNLFGRGFNEKRLSMIVSEYPEVFNDPIVERSQAIERICQIKGIALKTAEAFVDGIEPFMKFLKEANFVAKLTTLDTLPKFVSSADDSNTLASSLHILNGKTIVFTGMKESDIKTLKHTLETIGCKIGTSVSSKTFAVIANDVNSDSGKACDARKHNVPIMLMDTFISLYSL